MQVFKSPHGGWAAESHHPLVGNRQLRLYTMKRASGRIVTTANVETIETGGWTSFAPFSDFNTAVIATNGRATKSTIEQQHADALVHLEDLKTRALAHRAAA
jgi:hypothetical protein